MNLINLYENFISEWLILHGIKIALILLVSYFIQKLGTYFIEKAVRKAVKDNPQLSKSA